MELKSPSEASDVSAIMRLWPERSEGYNFSNLSSDASLIAAIMSLKSCDDLLL